jgi:hypothetical protein
MARHYKKFPEEMRRYKAEHPRDYWWMWANEVALNAAREEQARRDRNKK